MNSVNLTGNLTRDVELRWNNDLAIARFTLAVQRMKKDDGADFINIVVFGKQAENCEKYIAKGSKVGIQGRIQTGSYKNKDGNTVYTTDVIAERVEFLSKKQEHEGFSAIDTDECPF